MFCLWHSHDIKDVKIAKLGVHCWCKHDFEETDVQEGEILKCPKCKQCFIVRISVDLDNF